ncbi:ejaculatory bulb-specific protein 3 [Drosophila hydei]|uniref:Ejaculatory bulb-specific protein 3 n=1 Tax=Drosophila hydei TaxID=7224 RepID=A0A6J1MDV9_DROHY|nr:ejaculatory bulb-specific protein 3 [Drosophila hydei]XP_023179632.1 ejaculatory bulb-specific protein 3 [Drosophila hydei]XP_023179633.1 ejaculatory bulb-specific protein 3 [Drosophila hydei]
MKASLVILLIGVIVALASAKPDQKYTNKFDNVNVDEVLNNNRILDNYIRCLLENGPCTPEGRELKKLLPDALQSECSKCTEVQRRNSNKVINYLRARRPGDWKLLLDKYDSKGIYRSKYEKNAKH